MKCLRAGCLIIILPSVPVRYCPGAHLVKVTQIIIQTKHNTKQTTYGKAKIST